MGKPAVHVRRGDERVGDDGRLHRVVNRSIDATGVVTIAYDVIRRSGGASMEFEAVQPADARTADTGFVAPSVDTPTDDFEPA